jgi:hypothetical protein
MFPERPPQTKRRTETSPFPRRYQLSETKSPAPSLDRRRANERFAVGSDKCARLSRNCAMLHMFRSPLVISRFRFEATAATSARPGKPRALGDRTRGLPRSSARSTKPSGLGLPRLKLSLRDIQGEGRTRALTRLIAPA